MWMTTAGFRGHRVFFLALIVLFGISLSSCQTGKNFQEKQKLSDGTTTSVSEYTEIDQPRFNAFRFIEGFSKVEYSRRSSQNYDTERFYQGKYVAVIIQHVLDSWYSNSVETEMRDKSSFVEYLGHLKKSNLADLAKFVSVTNGYGYYVQDGSCVFARMAKRVKKMTLYDNDTGSIDSIIEVATCKGLSVSPETFLDLLEFAEDGERASHYRN